MKKIKLFLLLFFASTVVVGFAVPCFAMDTGFEIEYLTEEDITKINDRMCFQKVEKEPVIEKSFCCYDVNESGNLAVGFDSVRGLHYVIVYNSNGEFLYGISFNNPGAFNFEWNGDNIIIYIVRGQGAFLVDSEANIIEGADIIRSVENDEYWRKIGKRFKTVNDIEYRAKYSFNITGGYSKVVRVAPDGTEITVYEDSTADILGGVLTVAIVAITMVFPFIFVRKIKKQCAANMESDPNAE